MIRTIVTTLCHYAMVYITCTCSAVTNEGQGLYYCTTVLLQHQVTSNRLRVDRMCILQILNKKIMHICICMHIL